tara:strand:+ start:1163 stop:2449 length:1287 start_codon:yes stop_codon:yes gene_type:complete
MAIEDFIFNERDKDRFRRFAQFAKPSGASGGSQTPVIPAFDTSKLPGNTNYKGPLRKPNQEGAIIDLYPPTVEPRRMKDYLLGRKDNASTVTLNEKVNPFMSLIDSRFRNATGGATDAEIDAANQKRIDQNYLPSDVVIQFLDNNELVPLGRNRTQMTYAIAETTNPDREGASPRPYRIVGLESDPNGMVEYQKRVKSIIDNKDVKKTLGDYRTRQEGFQTLLSSGFTPGGVNASSDISLIFAFMKILDPSSVVRESEFALTEQKVDIREQVFGKNWRKFVNERGEFLSPEIRRNHINTSLATYFDQMNLASSKIKKISNIAARNGVLADEVVDDSSSSLIKNLTNSFLRTAKDGKMSLDDFSLYGDTLEKMGVLLSPDNNKLEHNKNMRTIITDLGYTPSADTKFANLKEYLDKSYPIDAKENDEEE